MNLLIQTIIALTNLYGLVNKSVVVDIYNSQNKEQTSLAAVGRLLADPPSALTDNFVYPDDDYFVNESVLEFEEKDELLADQAGKPRYVPPQAELLRYVAEDYYEETAAHRLLYDYVRKHLYPRNENKARELVEDIQLCCRIDFNMQSVMFEFNRRNLEFTDSGQVNTVMQLITDVYHDTRLWQNCGYTPRELFERFEKPFLRPLPEKPWTADIVDIRTREKVGRNDPCPCGSGRKYKNCCLGKAPADDPSE